MDRDMTTDKGRARLPELRLDRGTLEHNVQVMAAWCRNHRVELAPHIKTTMTRPVVERQLSAGAWGVTVATVAQAAIALEWGARRVIVANQVIHPTDLEIVRQWLGEVSDLELYCFVDSTTGIDLAREALAGAASPLRILIDIGTEGGRTGVRDPATAGALARDVHAAPELLLAGVAGYEGIRSNLRDAATLAAVDEHCRTAIKVFRNLASLFEVTQPVFSMGGSAFPDRVVRAVAAYLQRPDALGMVPVLRSGCYVTHDHGTYEHVSPVPDLKPALTVRAVVLSTPEPQRAVIGAGRRELPYDAGLPVLVRAHDAHGAPRPSAAATASQIYDHHLVLTQAHGLRVGDQVDLGISHPCSAFDRWPGITVVDGDDRTDEVWHPQFH
ncbi:hypothetical protein K530_51625 [Streptomyces noursei CCRC 11814]|uniref:Amino acid deaminase n=2 Tax=Streptomyces noursei TaxID=1971 RepID=A0A401QQ74_STRNR|nr:hypothetical protein K530_51625 [Streptomyces noursei CCRC 11814]GCB87569.1 amino acid deaminase [Streptomyces noursei]